MALKIPKIVYNALTVTFSLPPIKKPEVFERAAERFDSVTLSGVQQSVTHRVDLFMNLEWEYVPFEDLSAWEAFIDYAIEGAEFDYYPDIAESSFDTWILEDHGWKPTYNFVGYDKFTLRLKKFVAGEAGS